MKLEKLTKENVCRILNEMVEKEESIHTDEETQKENLEFVTSYVEAFLAIDDHFIQKPIIEAIDIRTRDLKKDNIDERAVLYKENGVYRCFYYKDSLNNKIYYTIDEIDNNVPDYYLVSPSRRSICHWHYCEDLDILIATDYSVKTTEKGPTVYTASTSRDIITRDKSRYNIGSSYYRISKNSYYHCAHDRNVEETITNQSLLKEFTKMFKQPIMNVGANNFLCIDTNAALDTFLAYSAKLEIKNGPKQNKINELTAITLPETKCDVPDDFNGETPSTPYSKTSIQKVKEGTCVVRWELCSKYSDVKCDGLRIYIEGSDIHPCKLNNDNKFVRTTISNIKPENFLSCNMDNVNPADLSGTILQYYGEILNDIPEKYRSLLLILFIKEPKIEQIFKMGLEKLIYEALDNKEYDVFKFVCGRLKIRYDKKEKNIFKFIGANKYQLAKFKDCINGPNKMSQDGRNKMLLYMKNIFGDALPNVDNKSFDAIFSIIAKLREKTITYYCYRDEVAYFTERISNIKKKIESTNNKNLIKRFFEILPDICKLGPDNIRYYEDYISMVSTMDDFKNFKIGFADAKETKAMHDAANAIYQLKREEYKTKAFKAQLVKVEKLEYENKDDDFCVVIPTEPGDLAKEGLELHHCVRSYIEKVANGTTNIVFIRKKSDKTKPFFTVEVSNDKVIEQVHGFGNRNADTEPNLTEFVNRWAKNKRLKTTNFNKIR